MTQQRKGGPAFQEKPRSREPQEELSQLRRALQLTGVVLCEWNLRTHELLPTAGCDHLLGYDLTQQERVEIWLARIHPDERDLVSRSVRNFQSAPQATCALDFRMRHRDGGYHWLRAEGALERDEHGAPERVVSKLLDITQRKERERALLEKERLQARMLADAAPHMMWELDPEGHVVYVNDRAFEYFGRQALDRSSWPEIVHPDDMAAVERYWQSLPAPPGPADGVELRMRNERGAYRWFWAHNAVVRDGSGRLLAVVGSATDIDDLKVAEQALREAKERLSAALEAAGMGTWVWSFADERNVWDRSMLKLLGREHENPVLSADEVMRTVHPDDRERVGQAMARALEPGETFDVEFRSLRADGGILWIASKGRIERDETGQPSRMVGACVDITRSKLLEEQLRQAQKMEAIGQLAGGVAHDFNNILMVILGEASLLAMQPTLAKSAKKAAEDIILAAERAASLTSQLLAFGRRQLLNMRETNLNEAVNAFSGMLQRMLGESVHLSLSLPPTGVVVRADSSMLSQVLLNLAINARDAMPHGGNLEIAVGSTQLTTADANMMAGASAGSWAYLRVRDEGQGIPGEVMPHIFEPFFTTKEVGKGTGLGLATVHGIVKQHNGFLHVTSQPRRGSTFTIFLPLLALNEQSSSRQSERSHQPRQGTGELIMLVEDEPAVRAVLSNVLENGGYRLLTARDGHEALKLFAEASEQIALVLTDVVMPDGINGVELVARLRERKPRLKAILSSGYSAEGLAQRVGAEQGVSFLPKPYKPNELLQLVCQVLNNQEP